MTFPLPSRRSARSAESGFSMIEMLMVAFIMAIGLLGLAALQTMSIRGGSKGRMLGTASFVAHGLLDQIQAEGAAASAQRYMTGTIIGTYPHVGSADASASGPNAEANKLTVDGLLATDPYYATLATPPATVFDLTWKRNAGFVNPTTRSAYQEFIVNVHWQEAGTGTQLVDKYFSVSRYVRM